MEEKIKEQMPFAKITSALAIYVVNGIEPLSEDEEAEIVSHLTAAKLWSPLPDLLHMANGARTAEEIRKYGIACVLTTESGLFCSQMALRM